MMFSNFHLCNKDPTLKVLEIGQSADTSGNFKNDTGHYISRFHKMHFIRAVFNYKFEILTLNFPFTCHLQSHSLHLSQEKPFTLAVRNYTPLIQEIYINT